MSVNNEQSTAPETQPPTSATLQSDPVEMAVEHWVAHGWGAASDGMALVTSVMRVQQIFLARVEAVLRPAGLTFARYEVLRLLAFTKVGTLPIGKIGERLQVHPASVTSAVHRLVRNGLVVRGPNPDDGRGVLVTLTDAGRGLVERCTELLNAQVFESMPMSTLTQRDVVAALREVRHAFGDFR